jgi:hypothetical protein
MAVCSLPSGCAGRPPMVTTCCNHTHLQKGSFSQRSAACVACVCTLALRVTLTKTDLMACKTSCARSVTRSGEARRCVGSMHLHVDCGCRFATLSYSVRSRCATDMSSGVVTCTNTRTGCGKGDNISHCMSSAVLNCQSHHQHTDVA